MSDTLILPEGSELRALRDQLETVKDFTVLSAGDSLSRVTRRIYLDLTFDLFQKSIHPSFLYGAFRDNEDHLSRIVREQVELVILRGYPFRTTSHELMIKQKILDQYASLLTEFHRAGVIYVPTVVSRNSLTASQNPPNRLIQAIRSGSTYSSPFRKNSRFFLIYDRDLLGFLVHQTAALREPVCLEGTETTLEEIAVKAERVTGHPVGLSGDGAAVVQYELPEGLVRMVPAVHYALEDMLVDITSYLF